MSYAELFVTSNFTFLTGASHAEELVGRAAELGLSAIAITDKNTFSGIVRGHGAAKELGVTYIVGVRLVLTDGAEILAWREARALARPTPVNYHDLMNNDHEQETRQAKRQARPAREPAQVYLDASEQRRLDRLTTQLDTTKSDVLRRGLEALEREVFDPDHHPALQIIGIADAEQTPDSDFDVAQEHDRYLSDLADPQGADGGSGGG